MAIVELIDNPADGTATPAGHFHAAEFDNLTRAANGQGVLAPTLDMTVTGVDMIVTIPAGTYVVPDGTGGSVTIIKTSTTDVTISASDPTDPRTDHIKCDANGTIDSTDGVATEETGDVEEAPMTALDSNAIMFAKVRVENGVSVIAIDKVVGRGVNVSARHPVTEGPLYPPPQFGHGVNNTTAQFNTNTTAGVALFPIGHRKAINTLTIDVTVVTVAGTLAWAIFSNDGQVRFVNEVTASISATGLHSDAVATVATLEPGLYYLMFVPVGTADLTLRIYGAGTVSSHAAPAGENEYAGTLAVSAGTIPATFDPDTDVTSNVNQALVHRID